MRSHVQTSSVFRVGKEGLTCGLHRQPQSREKVLWPHDIQGSRLCQEPDLRNFARGFSPEPEETAHCSAPEDYRHCLP